MTAIIDAHSCSLQTITPLHIGSGNTYARGVDYFPLQHSDMVTFHVLAGDWLNRVVGTLPPEEIDTLTSIFDGTSQKWSNAAQWLGNNRLQELSRHTLTLPGDAIPDVIQKQITDGWGAPILPGSSLKGAFRTAIVYGLIADNPDLQTALSDALANLKRQTNPRLKFADSAIVKKVLGSSPNSNLMRTLRVGDMSFAPEALACFAIRAFSLTRANTIVPKKDFLIVAEALQPQTTSSGRVSFDTFLQVEAEQNAKKQFNFQTRLDPASLLEKLNRLSERLLTQEHDFSTGIGGPAAASLAAKYKWLQDEWLATCSSQEAVFNLGWGIGWKGMTGELITEDDLSGNNHTLRKILKLASKEHYLEYPFPKTRRLALRENQYYPMGWVKIQLAPITPALREQERLALEDTRNQLAQRQLSAQNQDKAQAEAQERKQQEKAALERQQQEEAAEQARIEAMPDEERFLYKLEQDLFKDDSALGQDWKIFTAMTGETQVNAARLIKKFFLRSKSWKVKAQQKKQYAKVQAVKKILGES